MIKQRLEDNLDRIILHSVTGIDFEKYETVK